MMVPWQLPGPAGFLIQISDAIREGKHVIIGSPASMAQQLPRAVDEYLAKEWRVAGPWSVAAAHPLDDLGACLNLRPRSGARESIGTMLERLPERHVVIFRAIQAEVWPVWLNFIAEYANASRAVPTFERTQLICITDGVPRQQISVEHSGVRTFIWDGVIGEYDVLGHVMRQWRSRGRPIDVRAKLIARIIARIGLWDFGLVDQLMETDPHLLFDPVEVLTRCAATLPERNELRDTWESGGAAEFDGETLFHSLVLARAGDPAGELGMRLWAAQAAELLPVLEINRRRLAIRMKAVPVGVPIRLNGEGARDLMDLEIGDLFRTARDYRFPRDIVRLGEKFWMLRNKLAHLRPGSADEVLDSEILHSIRA